MTRMLKKQRLTAMEGKHHDAKPGYSRKTPKYDARSWRAIRDSLPDDPHARALAIFARHPWRSPLSESLECIQNGTLFLIYQVPHNTKHERTLLGSGKTRHAAWKEVASELYYEIEEYPRGTAPLDYGP